MLQERLISAMATQIIGILLLKTLFMLTTTKISKIEDVLLILQVSDVESRLVMGRPWQMMLICLTCEFLLFTYQKSVSQNMIPTHPHTPPQLYHWASNITMTSLWPRWRLKSPASRLFTQPFIQAQIKETTRAPCPWSLCRDFTGHLWIPRTKGQ